jgi:hypothetical protein
MDGRSEEYIMEECRVEMGCWVVDISISTARKWR